MQILPAGFLARRHLLRLVVGNAAWQAGEKVWRLFLGLFVGVWVARYLGPSSYGLLNYAIAFVALFAAAAESGMQAVLVRELVGRPEESQTILSSAFALRLTASVAACVLCIGLTQALRPGNIESLKIVTVIASSIVPQTWDLIDYEYQARLHPGVIVVVRATTFSIFCAFKVLLILLHARLLWFAIATLGESTACAIAMIFLPNARRVFTHFANISRTEISQLLHKCWPMAVAGLSVMLYMRIDQVMIGQMLTDQEVGIFAAAVRISESWYFVPMAIVSASAPALILTQNLSESAYRSQLQRIIRALCLLSIISATLMSLFSRPLIIHLYGYHYAEASTVLVVHAWAGVFVSLGVAASQWLINAGLLRLKMLQTIIGALINIALNLYFIRKIGVVGAAYATLASQFVSGFLINIATKTARPLFTIQLRAVLMLRSV